MNLTDEFEVGQAYETKGGEIWYVTKVEPDLNKVSTLILFSHVKSLCGRASWHIPTVSSYRTFKRLT